VPLIGRADEKPSHHIKDACGAGVTSLGRALSAAPGDRAVTRMRRVDNPAKTLWVCMTR
jgi:hypothetical protein